MKKLALVLLAFLSPLPCSAAQTADAPAPDAASILAALDTLEQKHRETREAGVSAVIKKVQDASRTPASAIDLYEQAVMGTQFAGLTRENGKFKEWKEKETNKLRDKNFATALQFHLTYLAITLKAAGSGKPELLVPDLINYTGDVWKADPEVLAQREWMGRSVSEGIFPQAFQLQGVFTGSDKWEMNPGNVDGIFQKTILPTLRKAKDTRALTYWDRRIELRSEQQKESGRAFDSGRFETLELPGLYWQRAQEYRHLDQPNRALSEMISVIRKYPDHPDLPKWVSDIRAALKSAAPTAPAEGQ